MGRSAGAGAGEAWTVFDDVTGWQAPFRTKGYGAATRQVRNVSVGIAVGVMIVLVITSLLVATRVSTFIIVNFVTIMAVLILALLPILRITRNMVRSLEALVKETGMLPDEAVGRVEAALRASREPFTRLSEVDPDRFWKDEYSETFTVSGGEAVIRVFDERPSGEGGATKVLLGPAMADSEQLLSTLAWHIDKEIPGAGPPEVGG